MIDRRQLIADAMRVRFRDVSDRIGSVSPDEFGEHAAFVSRVQEQFENSEAKTFRATQVESSDTWKQSEGSGTAALQALCLDQLEFTGHGEVPTPADEFVHQLKATRKDQSQCLEFLTSRYACPTNFTYRGDDAVREFALESLMVRDRRKIEEDSLAAADHDYLWYRLNLIAIHAAASDDLRFLDSLNYYFELMPDDWRPRSENNWLFVSYLALYARALIVR